MFDTEKETLKKSLGLNKDDFVLTCIAELNKNKNQKFLINAMEKIVKTNSNIHLLLVGKDSLNGYLSRMVVKKDLSNNVHFLGYRNDILKILKITNILVSASKREGLPVNILEAIFCKIPIVAMDARGVRDLIKNNINGYIAKKDDTEDFINKILQIKNNNNLQMNLDTYKYTKENVAKLMKTIYEKKKKVIMLRSTGIVNNARITKEAFSLFQKGYYVEILGWDRENSYLKRRFLDEKNKNIPISFYTRKSEYGAGIKNIIKMFLFELWIIRKLYKKRYSYDIIHSFDLDTGLISKIVSKVFHKKLVYDISDYYVDAHNLPKTLKNVLEKKEIKVINSADITIICSEWRKKQIEKSKPKNLLIIHNSPNISLDEIKKEKTIIKSNLDKVKICYVGVLGENRFLNEMLDIVKENKNLELHIGGFGKLKNTFEEADKIYSNVYFYGTMEYKKVLKLESECDILFAIYNPNIANHKYAAPNKLYEAMGLNKPIIVCNNTGIDSFVTKNNLGWTIDYSKEDFIKQFEDIFMKNIDKKYNNNDLFLQKYSWPKMEKVLLNGYEQLY